MGASVRTLADLAADEEEQVRELRGKAQRSVAPAQVGQAELEQVDQARELQARMQVSGQRVDLHAGRARRRRSIPALRCATAAAG